MNGHVDYWFLGLQFVVSKDTINGRIRAMHTEEFKTYAHQFYDGCECIWPRSASMSDEEYRQIEDKNLIRREEGISLHWSGSSLVCVEPRAHIRL